MELGDKTAFITGAAQGIGRGLAEALLSHKVKVFLVDVNATEGDATAKELTSRFGPDNVRYATVDITDHAKFTDAFNKAESEFGPIDIMINNAGILREELWKDMINVNLTATIFGTQLATEHMRTDKGGHGGRIINMASTAGLVSFFLIPVYCATKHGVRAFTTAMAENPHTKERGIQYAAICPGPVDTALRKIVEEDFKALGMDSPGMPVSRIAECLMELLQLENMNGSILLVDGTIKQFVKADYKPVDLQSSGSENN